MIDDIYLRASQISYFRLAAQRHGVTLAQQEAILEGAGVSAAEADDPQIVLSFSQLTRLVDNMNHLCGEGWFLGTPELWTLASFRPLGVAAITSPNLGAALEVVVQHIPTGVTQQRLSLVHQSGVAVLRHTLAAAVSESEHRYFAFSVLLGLSTIFEGLLGAEKSALGYQFIWNEPTYAAELEKALGGPIRWRAEVNAVIVPQRLLGVRSLLADPSLHLAALESLMEARRRPTAEGVKEHTARLLSHAKHPRLRVDEAARALGLSQRTLTRRLLQQGVTYRSLVDEELKARTRRWLAGGALTHAEIAERLGFADVTSFNRACRRWFRSPPRPDGPVNDSGPGAIARVRRPPQSNAA